MSDIQSFRHEEKYLIPLVSVGPLTERLSVVATLDRHSKTTGYNVRSCYFDDYSDTCYMDNLRGVDYRAKWRIRIYDANDQYISLEKKGKRRGLTTKESCQISRKIAEELINGEDLMMNREFPPLLNVFLFQKQTRFMKPTIIVDYNRIPYVSYFSNIRITFDLNIATSKDYNHFFSDTINKKRIVDMGCGLLEVKYDQCIPDYFYHVIQQTRYRMISFSKYCICRKELLA